MNRSKLSMGATDGAFTGVLSALVVWKLSQPQMWQILTGGTFWLGLWPVAIVLAGAAIGAAVGAVAAQAVGRTRGFLPVAVRWGLLLACAGAATWVGARSAQGRGPRAEVAWADLTRATLSTCDGYDTRDAASVSEWAELALRRAECVKIRNEVEGAETAGRAEHERGAEFALISKTEREHLEKLRASATAAHVKPDKPKTPAEALQYGKEIAKVAMSLPPPKPPPAATGGSTGNAGRKTGGGGEQPLRSTSADGSAVGKAGGGTTLDSGTLAGVEGQADAGAVARVDKPGFGGTSPIDAPNLDVEPPLVPGSDGTIATSSQGGGGGGPSPFETIAATATCMYFGAPPQLCMAALSLVNKLLGGLFGGDTEVRQEEIAKLLGALGEFAGTNGDFASFDPATFQQRFAEFGFKDPQEAAQAFGTLLGELKNVPDLKLDLAGVERALGAVDALKDRFDHVSQCARSLRDFANVRLPASPTPAQLAQLLADTNQQLRGLCIAPVDIQTPDQVLRYFQEAELLRGEELVTCAFAIAVQRRGVATSLLQQANLPSAEGCTATKAIVDGLRSAGVGSSLRSP